jgi:hypothetical protein
MKIIEVTHSPAYLLQRNQDRNSLTWRDKQRQRFHDEQEMAYDQRHRHIPKSQIGYKPFGIPLVRFGKFGTRSGNYLYYSGDADADSELRNSTGLDATTWPTHESGVSCFQASKRADGWDVFEPNPSRATHATDDPFALVHNFVPQLIRYQDTGQPMDIFLIFGHLKSFGKAQEWLDLGADGEFLLDTSKPYKAENLAPEQIFINRKNLIDYMNYRLKGYGGLDGYRQYLEREREFAGE